MVSGSIWEVQGAAEGVTKKGGELRLTKKGGELGGLKRGGELAVARLWRVTSVLSPLATRCSPEANN